MKSAITFVMIFTGALVHLQAQTATLTDNVTGSTINFTVGDSDTWSFHGAANAAIVSYSRHDGGTLTGPFAFATTDASGNYTHNGTVADPGTWDIYYTIGGVNVSHYPVSFLVNSTVTPTESTSYVSFSGSLNSYAYANFQATISGDDYTGRVVGESFTNFHDNCHFTGSVFAELTVGPLNANASTWSINQSGQYGGYDSIGMNPDSGWTEYYQANLSLTPGGSSCGWVVDHHHFIFTAAGQTTYDSSHTSGYNIPSSTTVSAFRSGVSSGSVAFP